MTNNKQQLEQILAAMPPRALNSTLFNMAKAYYESGLSSLKLMESEKNADFAAPSIMCQSFAIELLLKFFIVTDNPTHATVKELTNAGIVMRGHKYSQLFDSLLPVTKDNIAKKYTDVSRQATDANGFRKILISQGDDPFVNWRYIYESSGNSHFDLAIFRNVAQSLGEAAADVRAKITTATNTP